MIKKHVLVTGTMMTFRNVLLERGRNHNAFKNKI